MLLDRKFASWFLISFFYAYQYVLRVLPNIVSNIVMDKFNVGILAFGQFSGLYYIGYTLAHIPVGIMLDRYGPKKIIPIFIAVTFIGLVPLLFNSWIFVQIGRIIVGIGSVVGALGIFKISNMYFPGTFARMVGCSIIIGLLGAMYGGLPVSSLINIYGWMSLVLGLIIIGAILCIVMYFVMIPSESNGYDNNFVNQFKLIICNKNILLISLFAGLMVGPLEGFADGWATVFLLTIGMSSETAKLLPSAIFCGMCVGSFVIPYMLERSFNSWNIVISCAAIMCISLFLLFAVCDSVLCVFILFLIIGFCSAYQIVATCNAVTYSDGRSVALVTAISNMIIMCFGYIFHTIISWIVHLYWDGRIVEGIAVYEIDLLIKALMVIPIGLIIGLVGFVWIKYRIRN
ncbi:MFS transporter [Neoehrlichia mikurensis]|uniref:MFS transporter n=1 Tax=Neoehrlichia mikurensis TaxID=89586 RepID=A0A9Q9F434_9RICK|nr:MFS transporter [Neoehrlichia mikurensis]QXK91682.1 MFS transporter [Neoehrlichia mikurensis]QXK92893.1 MFS transporter [Neoehrlichia mikurensis]QXK93373.1 MFS transporter [Neoehrlichia mikurensis]UTO55682.1 MFS transporter [Neoehrlichia mikurensis]UTO56600.1 MFS transporter [Neoehrlichia mikurensis]